MEGQWCTIESDPMVFTHLSKKLGIKNVQFVEVLDLDSAESCLEFYEHVYGFIFLFKWNPLVKTSKLEGISSPCFFIKQVVNNACATISILNIAFNFSDIELNESLSDFKSFISDLPPEMRGLALTNSEEIRIAHNSFITAESLNSNKEDFHGKEGDAFHFIALLPKEGMLYELDGMKEEVEAVAEYTDNMTSIAMEYVKQRIELAKGELHFSLLAMIPDQILALEQQLSICEDEILGQEIKLKIEAEKKSRMMRQEANEPSNDDQLKKALELIQGMQTRGLFNYSQKR